jgi:glycosyltransferase involved in cell wall biosynthesis
MDSLRTLVVAENLPYPTLKGGDLRSWQNVNALAGMGQVGVFGLCSNDRRHAVKAPPRVSVWRSSSDPALAFPPQRNRKLSARAWFLSPTGHPADVYYSRQAVSEIADVIAEFEPHVVLIERLWLHHYINPVKSLGCRVILDNHNVESVLYRQIAESTLGDDLPARIVHDFIPVRTETIERQAAQAADQIWVCSVNDEQLMRRAYGTRVPIRVVTNGVDVDRYRRTPTPPGAGAARSLVLPAAFAFPPNAQAARFLTDELFPRLTANDPDSRLVLVGSMPTSHMIEAARRDSRILVTGAVRDVRPYIAAASAMVAPVFEASGTRFKILEAFASKIPVITTSKGAEGLGATDGKDLLLAENVEQFVAAIKRLWANDRLVARVTTNAFELVREHHSWAVARAQIRKAVHELMQVDGGVSR